MVQEIVKTDFKLFVKIVRVIKTAIIAILRRITVLMGMEIARGIHAQVHALVYVLKEVREVVLL
jgi:hypothetical protein